MIRSTFASTRLLVLPYGALLALFLLAAIGGGRWLYLVAQEAQARRAIDSLAATLEPLTERLAVQPALAAPGARASLPGTDWGELFAALPALREVSVADQDHGLRVRRDQAGGIERRTDVPLATQSIAIHPPPQAAQRLLTEAGSVFNLRFDPSPAEGRPLQFDFSFDRAALLAGIDTALKPLRQAILLLSVAGSLCILIALWIAAYAIGMGRRAEEHFQEVYRRASLTEVAAQLVHDLRNPLMALRTNAKALLVSPGQTAEIAAELDRDIVALNEKLTGFLNLTNHHKEPFAPIDPATLIGEAARLAGPILTELGLGVALDIEPNLPRPVVQSGAIRDALLNLLINAAQSGQRSGQLRIRARQTGDSLSIQVEDRGQGITTADLPRLFDAFFTTKTGGHGLGLAIVRRIVEAHHGQVRAENRAGGGARVILRLPLAQPEIPKWWTAQPTRSPT